MRYTEDIATRVTEIYNSCIDRTEKGLDDFIVTRAVGTATDSTKDFKHAFKVLASLNLLNAAIKDKRWKSMLSYRFIKGLACRVFERLETRPVEGIRYSYDPLEMVLYFDARGVIFSFHHVPMSMRLRSFVQSERNIPIEWKGVRLQAIPVELYNLASE